MRHFRSTDNVSAEVINASLLDSSINVNAPKMREPQIYVKLPQTQVSVFDEDGGGRQLNGRAKIVARW